MFIFNEDRSDWGPNWSRTELTEGRSDRGPKWMCTSVLGPKWPRTEVTKDRSDWWPKEKTQMIWETSSAGRFDIYEPVKILWFGYMEEVVCNGNDLILNLLFNFEPMKRLEPWGNVRMFESASNSVCKSILNMLKALNLSDG